jgi:hypothetical protein
MDILPGIAALLVLATFCFLLGVRMTHGSSERRAGLLALSCVGTLIFGFLFVQDRLVLAHLFPFPGVVVLGNTPLPLIALLCGILLEHLKERGRRPAPLIALLLVLATAHAIRPFWGQPPQMNPENVQDGVVMQTSDSSCSAASAATLLRYHGIPATEQEMAQLAFTRRDGTAMLGVYRALRRKTEGTPFRVEVLSGADAPELRRAAEEGPVLLSVGLDRFARDVDPRYQSEWGWTPGLYHAVVLFHFLPDGKLEIGDPSVGREKWGTVSLGVLWHGEGIRLVRR